MTKMESMIEVFSDNFNVTCEQSTFDKLSDAVMHEFNEAIREHGKKVRRLRKEKVFCDVRFTYRDTRGTHRSWFHCDQNDLAEFVKYMKDDLTWVLCQCLSGEHAGEWRFMTGATKKWSTPSERLVSQILYDVFGIVTVGSKKLAKEHAEGLREVFG